jgi:glycosyltransferase involved in cell wall biosynthesis
LEQAVPSEETQSDSATVPRVSVHMPVYNSERYLDEAVGSIRAQTFEDWELIVIDDGSTDGSLAVLERHADADPRVRLANRENRGIGVTRNECLSLARGEFFAAMDSDDISHPERLERQVEYLDNHHDCVAVGTRVRLIDPDGSEIRDWSEFVTHEEIDRAHLAGHGGAMTHPASMFRRQALVDLGGYRSELDPAEDFDLFLRLGEVGKLHNLPEVHFSYRQHLQSAGHARHACQRAGFWRAIQEAHERRGLPIPQLPAVGDEKIATPAEIHRKWTWWALKGRHVGTARKHAWYAVRSAPASSENWRALYCALRGY